MGTITEYIEKFRNPGGMQNAMNDSVTVASAAAMPAANALITVVSGTAQITTITLPWAGFSGFILYRPTGAFTGATGGALTATASPVGLAFTAVVGKILMMTYDPTSQLWYPSYTS